MTGLSSSGGVKAAPSAPSVTSSVATTSSLPPHLRAKGPASVVSDTSSKFAKVKAKPQKITMVSTHVLGLRSECMLTACCRTPLSVFVRPTLWRTTTSPCSLMIRTEEWRHKAQSLNTRTMPPTWSQLEYIISAARFYYLELLNQPELAACLSCDRRRIQHAHQGGRFGSFYNLST